MAAKQFQALVLAAGDMYLRGTQGEYKGENLSKEFEAAMGDEDFEMGTSLAQEFEQDINEAANAGTGTCPATTEVRQPTGFERAATFRTRRLSKICRLGNRLGNSAVKNFLQAMSQERIVKCCWQYQMVVAAGRRCSVAQVHRHMGALTGTSTETYKTNLPRQNDPLDGALLARFASGAQEDLVTSNQGWIETIYSPYNASFYEQIAYGMGAMGIGSILGNAGTSGPIVTADISGSGSNFLKIGDGLNANVAPHSNVDSSFYTPPAFSDDNEITTSNTTKKIFQRHSAGGVDINVLNMSEYPMNVDIVVFRCKTTAIGDDDMVPTTLTSTGVTATDNTNVLYLTHRYGDAVASEYQVADAYNPVANILAANVQKWWNWHNYLKQGTAKDGGDTELPGAILNQANFSFTTNSNPLADPNWKFLANYGTSSRVLGESKAGAGSDLHGSTENYKEVNRVRVIIPVSGSYKHKLVFGGMQYDVVDRINRSRNQKAAYMEVAGQTVAPTYRITDIRGETYVIFVSAAGAQQPGKNLANPNKIGVMTPAGNLAVRVEEYEVIQPFYSDVEKQKPVYTKGSIKPNDDLAPLDLVPLTQNVKVTNNS